MTPAFPDPFETLFNLQQALDSYRQSRWLDGQSGGGAYPPLNVFAKDEDFIVVAELPGIRKEDLDIQVKGNRLRIAGAKAVDYPEKASLHRRERPTGQFDRTISIPVEIDPDGVKAEYRDGVLAVYLPRAERDKPRKVAIS